MKIPDVLNQAEVLKLTGFPRSTMYHLIATAGFPKPKKIGIRMARWSKKEILSWFESNGFYINVEDKM